MQNNGASNPGQVFHTYIEEVNNGIVEWPRVSREDQQLSENKLTNFSP